ncbi:MAG: hypothetical protein A2Z64_05180 [Betaproteobacteria bacterium RIFCSPLOWO2_02_67_12]|nr:MAG: hypothetical protein A2Z64_05180 [Betaproteobacteria bacterium RIFCSPLOWO2_02_67_12]
MRARLRRVAAGLSVALVRLRNTMAVARALAVCDGGLGGAQILVGVEQVVEHALAERRGFLRDARDARARLHDAVA